MNQESFSFVIYMIHACANKWGKLPSEVYTMLSSVDCINNYLVKHFDIIHTQSTSYVIDDITDYLNARHKMHTPFLAYEEGKILLLEISPKEKI